MDRFLMWRAVIDSYRFTFGNIGLLIKISLVWVIVSYAAAFAGTYGLIPAAPVGDWINTAISRALPDAVGLIAISAVAVVWHRANLLEERPAVPFATPFRKRVWKYLVASVVLAGLSYLIFALSSLFILGLVGAGWTFTALIVAVFALIYLVFIRLSLLYPAIAIQSATVTLKRSWRLTKGNAFRLLAGMIIGVLPFSLAAKQLADWSDRLLAAGNLGPGVASGLFGHALIFFCVALITTFLSESYRDLVPEVRDSIFEQE